MNKGCCGESSYTRRQSLFESSAHLGFYFPIRLSLTNPTYAYTAKTVSDKLSFSGLKGPPRRAFCHFTSCSRERSHCHSACFSIIGAIRMASRQLTMDVAHTTIWRMGAYVGEPAGRCLTEHYNYSLRRLICHPQMSKLY